MHDMKCFKKYFIKIGLLVGAIVSCLSLLICRTFASSNDLSGLINYNAISAYYSNSVVYYSQDNGSTYQSMMSQGVSTSIVNNNLRVEKTSPWGSNYLYFVRIDFTSAFSLKKVSFYGANRPNPTNVVVNDILFSGWNYTIVDNVSYLYIDNIYQFTNEIYVYFSIDSYTNGGNRYFDILIEGVQTSFEAYQNGYNDGYQNGYNEGYEQGGLIVGQEKFEQGEQMGYDIGYQYGFADGEENSFESTGFKNLLSSIFDYPINMIRGVFDFNFMGVNIASLIMFIVSIGIVIFVIRRFRK